MAKQDPYRNFRFRVEIDGIEGAGFTDCTGFGASLDVIEYREGGEPAYTRKLTGLAKYSNIVLKWGIIDDRRLVDWFAEVAAGTITRKNGSIVLVDTTGKDAPVRWNFYNALPVKYDAPDLSAKSNEVAVDMLELAVDWMERAKK